MKFDELNHENWMIFAIKHYDNPLSVTYEDFEEDLKRFKYIKPVSYTHLTLPTILRV